jgi:uncharacterized RDD family membrane protein YckC
MGRENRSYETKPRRVSEKSPNLIEFPGTARMSTRPNWRDELTERVRRIQEKRAQEGSSEEETRPARNSQLKPQSRAVKSRLGVIPQNENSSTSNPIIEAALRRAERAREQAQLRPPRQTSQPVRDKHSTSTGAAAAAVKAVKEEVQSSIVEPPVVEESLEQPVEVAQPFETYYEPLVEEPIPAGETLNGTQPVVELQASVETETEPIPQTDAEKSSRRKIFACPVDDSLLARIDSELVEEARQHQVATFTERILSGAIDIVVLAFLTVPFASIIELIYGNWSDSRIIGLMCGVVMLLVVTYQTLAFTFPGQTCGMWLLSLRAVDSKTGFTPTFGQSLKRSIFFLFSLLFAGLGILYSLLDRDRRTAHDVMSRTQIVHE